METALGILFWIAALALQFGVVFVFLLGASWVLDKLGMLPETEQEKQAMMMGIIIGSAMVKPDDKPPSE